MGPSTLPPFVSQKAADPLYNVRFVHEQCIFFCLRSRLIFLYYLLF